LKTLKLIREYEREREDYEGAGDCILLILLRRGTVGPTIGTLLNKDPYVLSSSPTLFHLLRGIHYFKLLLHRALCKSEIESTSFIHYNFKKKVYLNEIKVNITHLIHTYVKSELINNLLLYQV